MPDHVHAHADKLWTFGLVVLLPIACMLLLGIDANWDLSNYHLYDPHAWLTGRMALDIAPAQLQTWHNPLLDVPLYLLVTSGLNARWASAWLTIPVVFSLFFLLRLQRLLSPAPPTRLSQLFLVVLAMTGAATYSTFANSMNDSFVAAAMLGCLAIILGDERGGTVHRRWLLAGLIAGAFAGLKLTAAFYCIGLAFSALAGGDWKQKFLRMGSLALGGTIGFLLTYAYWGWHLFKTYQNPFFPYFNNIFRSPYALANPWADTRFRPETVVDALLSPLHLLGRSQRFSELALSDPRMLLGLLGLAALCALYRKRMPPLASKFGILLVFFIASFLLWIFQFGIYRYASTLELLGCLAAALLLQLLPRWRNSALLIAALLVSADTKRPNWGRVRSSAPVAGIVPPVIPDNSIVIIASGRPLAYLALGVPNSVPLIAVSNNMMSPTSCSRLQARANDTIARHAGPIWLLSSDEGGPREGQSLLIRHYGLQVAGPCLPFNSSFGNASLCPQRRIVARARAPVLACAAQP